jgi:hypothetical protein
MVIEVYFDQFGLFQGKNGLVFTFQVIQRHFSCPKTPVFAFFHVKLWSPNHSESDYFDHFDFPSCPGTLRGHSGPFFRSFWTILEQYFCLFIAIFDEKRTSFPLFEL